MGDGPPELQEQIGVASRRGTLVDLARLFLRLGAIGFGGPAAHIALMEDEFVRRRRWLSAGEFLDLLGATNLIPGPNSTEMAIHIGRQRAGWPGLLVAGCCFIAPAFMITLVFAWAYVRYSSLPAIEGLLYGIKPVIVAVVVQALWKLGQSAVKDAFLGVVGIGAAILEVSGVNELAILAGAGLFVAIARILGRPHPRPAAAAVVAAPLPKLLVLAGVGAGAAAPFSLSTLFLFFLKVGSVLFGSGYVLLAFLRADLVDRWHWLTESQLLDAVAVGQFTPGPVFTTATFIGYLLGGTPGAFLATIGIFLPAFVFVAVSAPLVARLRRSAVAGRFLDGVVVASMALLLVVAWHLGRAALVDLSTVVLALAALAALYRYQISSVWLVAAGAAAGVALQLLRG